MRGAAVATLRSRRLWLWEIAGAILYGIPVAIRFATKNVSIPILNFPGFWIGHFIPGNFLEKLLVNSFFPGGAGGIAGETFISNFKTGAVRGKTKYFSRLAGALFQTAAWSAFQIWGYLFFVTGPYGGNVFEHPIVFPINFALAVLSIFTPDVVNFFALLLEKAYASLGKLKMTRRRDYLLSTQSKTSQMHLELRFYTTFFNTHLEKARNRTTNKIILINANRPLQVGFDSSHPTNGTAKVPNITSMMKLPIIEIHTTIIPATNNLTSDIYFNHLLRW